MRKQVLIDSNVIIDILTEDPHWFDWSSNQLAILAEEYQLIINQVIYAEVSVRFKSIEELEMALPDIFFQKVTLPWEAGFLAAKVFHKYRKNTGAKNSPLPDFFIGAHAAVAGISLCTRDPKRYRTYFPRLQIICP